MVFNKNFYPSPIPVIEEIIKGYDFSGKKVMDGSAGKADILDYIYQLLLHNNQGKDNGFKKNLYAVEIEPDLRAIIHSKGYQVMGEDFLQYYPDLFLDVFCLNPPFDHAIKHFLHAYSIREHAEIRCLLNKTNIEDISNTERAILQEVLAKENIEPIDLGKCFTQAERTTNVEVSLIIIPGKDKKQKFSFSGKKTGEKLYGFEDIKNTQLETVNVIDSLVYRYNKTKELAVKMLALNEELEFYSQGLNWKDIGDLAGFYKENRNKKDTFESFVESLRKGAWNKIINQAKIDSFLTSNVKKEFHETQSEQGYMAFTGENIENLIYSLMGSVNELKQRCIEEAFDLLTGFHKDNKTSWQGWDGKHHFDGWKTNSAWMVAKKIILPYGCHSGLGKWPTDHISLNYDKADKLDDIEKALCFVTGKKYEDITKNTMRYVIDRTEEEYTYIRQAGWYYGTRYEEDTVMTGKRNRRLQFHQWYESEFFKFYAYKKGTIHIIFKDDKVYQDFNLAVAKHRKWIPSDYGHSTTQNKAKSHPKAKAHNMGGSNKEKVYSTEVKPKIDIDDLLWTVNDILTSKIADSEPGQVSIF